MKMLRDRLHAHATQYHILINHRFQLINNTYEGTPRQATKLHWRRERLQGKTTNFFGAIL